MTRPVPRKGVGSVPRDASALCRRVRANTSRDPTANGAAAPLTERRRRQGTPCRRGVTAREGARLRPRPGWRPRNRRGWGRVRGRDRVESESLPLEASQLPLDRQLVAEAGSSWQKPAAHGGSRQLVAEAGSSWRQPAPWGSVRMVRMRELRSGSTRRNPGASDTTVTSVTYSAR